LKLQESRQTARLKKEIICLSGIFA